MYGIADGLMQRLQAIENAAARLITGARWRDHISPVLPQLHWLPVRQRVQFKLAVLVFKALHGQAPRCLTDDSQLVAAAGRRQLQRCCGRKMCSSAGIIFPTCLVPRTRTCLGDRAFGFAGPRLWNALPISLRQPHLSLGQFRRALKTHLFDCVCRA